MNIHPPPPINALVTALGIIVESLQGFFSLTKTIITVVEGLILAALLYNF